MVESLGQTYHYSYDECMRLTMPQIIMLTHASKVNRIRMEARLNKGRNGDGSVTDRMEGALNARETFNGKPIDQLNSEEYVAYLAL